MAEVGEEQKNRNQREDKTKGQRGKARKKIKREGQS